MALTRAFKKTVQDRVRRDPAFRDALLRQGVETLLAGDAATGKSILRDYIKSTVGFETLARATGTPPKSLMRMFSAQGNPRLSNVLAVLDQLQVASGRRLEVRVR